MCSLNQIGWSRIYSQFPRKSREEEEEDGEKEGEEQPGEKKHKKEKKTKTKKQKMQSEVTHLYLDINAHPCRAVEMVVGMIGSKVERHYLDLLANDQYSKEYLELNPLHRVPFLVDGDLKLGESRTIMRYLADRDLPPNNTLYPRADLRQRAKIDEILDLDSGTLCTLVYDVFKPKFFGLAEELDKYGEFRFREILDYLDSRLRQNGGKRFLLGDHITIADIGLVASLSVPDICEFDFGTFPRLNEYLQRLSNSIPRYKEINEQAVNKYRDLMRVLQG